MRDEAGNHVRRLVGAACYGCSGVGAFVNQYLIACSERFSYRFFVGRIADNTEYSI